MTVIDEACADVQSSVFKRLSVLNPPWRQVTLLPGPAGLVFIKAFYSSCSGVMFLHHLQPPPAGPHLRTGELIRQKVRTSSSWTFLAAAAASLRRRSDGHVTVHMRRVCVAMTSAL